MNVVKKILLGLIPLLVIGAGICYYFYTERGYSFNQKSIFDVVAPETPVFMQINDPLALIDAIDHSDSLVSAIFSVESFSKVKTLAQTLNAIVAENPDLKKNLSSRKMLMALNFEGKGNVRPLFVLPLSSSSEFDLLEGLFEKEAANRKWNLSKRKYNERNIYEATNSTGSREMEMALADGMILFSQSPLQIENAIIQLDGESLLENPDFLKISKTVGNQSALGVFVNHQTISKILKKYGSERLQKWSTYLSGFSNWSELDLSSMGNQLYISGFSNASSETLLYSDVLKTQKSVQSNAESVLPKETAFFLSLSLSDYSNFQRAYSDFVNKKESYGKVQKEQEKLRSQGYDLSKIFGEIFAHDVFFAGMYDQKSNSISSEIFLLETKSGSVAIEKMKELQQEYLSKNKTDKSSWQAKLKVDDQTTVDLYRFPFANMPCFLFGNLFRNVKSQWVAVWGNYLVFSDREDAFVPFFKANSLGETLEKNNDYQKFKSELVSRSNLVLYCNAEYAMGEVASFFEDKISADLLSSTEIAKFRHFCWQVSASGDRIYNGACLQFVPNGPLKQKYVWQISVDAPIVSAPQKVKNAINKRANEIMVQDEQNNLYLIGQAGRVQWKRKLDGRVLGTIYQMEPNRGEPLQYAMNTETSIYVLDQKGGNAEGFPILLNDKATSPLSVFDYERNHVYRLFVACSDQKIRAYGTDGNPVDGWEPFSTDHLVKQPIRHFRIEGKDYIVAADAMKDYILDRRGNIRVKTDAVYAHSSLNNIVLEDRNSLHGSRFVITDQHGVVHYSDFEGKHFQHSLDSLDDNHFFASVCLKSEDQHEYLVAVGNVLKIFDTERTLGWKREFDAPITSAPAVVQLPSGEKAIAVVCASINRIYLVDQKGELYPGFPLEGNSPFLVLVQNGEKSKFNVVVTDVNGQLNNYIIE